MHSSPYPYPPLPPPPLPASPPLPYVAISTLIVVYVVLSYVIIDFIGRNDEHMTGSEVKKRLVHLSLRDLEGLPWFYYKVDTGVSCVICLESFRKGERCRYLPVCKHTFHAPCIDLWLLKKLSCPTCRSPFVINSGFDAV
ncbi:RING/U-box superfamily protein [Euphorbia peplus]|nr:RING/U-box superfamily protein [Euphorbia peplus]